MIQEFSVQNFRSIKEKQTISFLANKKMHSGAESYVCTQVTDTVQLLKFCVLYGYNASGKSNLLLALDFLRDIVISGPETKEQITGYQPFALDESYRNQPGSFFLIFYVDGVRYEYSVTLDEKRIHHESLRFAPEGRIATLFSRTFDTENNVARLSIGAKCQFSANDKTILKGNTLENLTVLFAYQKSNIHSKELDLVVSYFRKTLLPRITPQILLRNWSLDRIATDSSRKSFYVDFLAKADFQISDLVVKSEKVHITDHLLENLLEQGAPPALLDQLKGQQDIESRKLLFTHATNKGTYPIPADDESQGTLRYFGLGGVLHELISQPHMVAIDELESSLHPDLVSFFLQMVMMNAHDSQLLVTTHAPYIMELDYMRNDMIWFCEKNEDGGSEYYCAQDFRLHKNNSIANFYQAGKLGAKPILGSPLLRRREDG
ncbi:MAG: hypothetical protein PWP25_1651 [Sphaerochaeta sp.]|nr:hypothetical protein [Sphaerochaeta sp.]